MMRSTKKVTKSLFLSIAFSLVAFQAHAEAASSVYIEELTWMEIQARLQSGATTAIVPTGGTQQEGPHMVTGAHNVIARYTAGEIARRLSNALVAPVITYTPAGRITPPEGHMQFAGTLSISEHTYELMLEGAIRSLKQHGFHLICLIGDQGGSQKGQSIVAEKLNDEWRTDGVKVLNVSDYYYKNGQDEWSDTMPMKVPNATAHAGHIQTSELMAIDAGGVRDNMRGVRTERDYKTTGAMGDSSVASATYGRKYLSLKIEAAIKQIQNASNNAK